MVTGFYEVCRDYEMAKRKWQNYSYWFAYGQNTERNFAKSVIS